ncbi:peptidoglycan editing factor PgeF [Paenibacillus hexagrammi]|uniref:Purine nucleoside phosphorylase n=1 Tax=Paenibacillus hexagrammi TaxID=2908839 RepID=A0ABY3SQ07_9BACL|nr:peptidoglycan editing factor PgeF [Paenibacillus sp. YPD9-1]UJF35146.1 peptidoglycan editing factor PgeF [Paenibacillus sp. YPD9-1]
MEPFVIRERKGQLTLLELEAWTRHFPKLTAGFTSRLGGISEAPFGTLNCGLHVMDNEQHVVMNRRLIADAIDQPFEQFTFAEQVHGCDVQVVTAEEAGKGKDSREHAIQAKDAMITNVPGAILCTQYADCVPLFFYDPVNKAAGLAHAGWKGTVLKISMATISSMTHTFGSKPADIRAVIGPSIGVCCYEVDETVAQRVKACLEETKVSSEAAALVLISKENGKYMLNLQELNRILINQAGILSSHIEVTQLCTSCRTDLFFSHRKEGGATGRMIAWIGLKDEGDSRDGLN